ncbi:MAG: LolA-like putative outer membrane lipoprotein chaperone [Rikenellaceae bacterium]
MKKIITTLLFCSSALFCMAQQTEITELLTKITKPYIENTDFSFKFSAQISSNNIEGTIKVSGDKYRIDTNDFTMIFDGKDRYNYVKKNNEVYIETLVIDGKEIDIMQSPQRLLKLTKNSTPTLSTNSKGNRELFFEKEGLKVSIDSSDNISSINVINNKSTIYILDSDTNIKFSESTFIFDKEDYKGVEIIDFR